MAVWAMGDAHGTVLKLGQLWGSRARSKHRHIDWRGLQPDLHV